MARRKKVLRHGVFVADDLRAVNTDDLDRKPARFLVSVGVSVRLAIRESHDGGVDAWLSEEPELSIHGQPRQHVELGAHSSVQFRVESALECMSRNGRCGLCATHGRGGNLSLLLLDLAREALKQFLVVVLRQLPPVGAGR